MQPLPQKYADIVQKSLRENPSFDAAYSIVEKNAQSGEIYLLGGMTYRPIIKELYGTDIKTGIDYDFMVQKSITDPSAIRLPEGWELGRTHLSNFKFTFGELRIDYLPSDMFVLEDDLPYVHTMTMIEKISSYLRLVPLSLQSIIYDISRNTLYGDTSLKSITQRSVWINNVDSATRYCAMYNDMSVIEYMKRKYDGLGFGYVTEEQL